MIYVMSDIHGCYHKYMTMLQKIHFTSSDTLYILGDVVDRGHNGLKTLLDISKRNNIILLLGNHDQMALIFLTCLPQIAAKAVSAQFINRYEDWLSDGGQETQDEFLQLTKSEQEIVLTTIKQALIYKKVKFANQCYFLAHTVPEKEIMLNFASCTKQDFIWGEPDYELSYYEDKIVITGHTPTSFIDLEYKGRMWMKNHHIAIDCGAAFGNSLGCLCLDTMEEFYVE